MTNLEKAVDALGRTKLDIDDIIFKVGDAKKEPTEDELLNLLIGLHSLFSVRQERLKQELKNISQPHHFNERA